MPSASSDAFDQTVTRIPSCALDEVGKHEQRARYALLASSVTRVERQPRAVLIYFDRDLDRQTLQQALGIERECCPFFTFVLEREPTGGALWLRLTGPEGTKQVLSDVFT